MEIAMKFSKLAYALNLLAIVISCAGKSTINNNPNIIVPAAPSELRARALSPTEIRLEWRDNSTDEDFFAIYRYDRAHAGFSILGRTNANTEIYSDISVEDSTEYMYYIVAEKGDTVSDKSNLATAMTFVNGMYYVGGIQAGFPDGKLVLGNGSIFIGSSDSTISSINILFPQNPIIDERFRVPGSVRSITQSGTTLTLALGLGGMALVSVYDPVHLETLGRCYTPNSTTNAIATDNYVYAIDNSALCIIDASNPHSPNLVGSLIDNTFANVNALCSEGNFIYLACGDSGLVVVNILDRIHPVIVGHLDTPGSAKDLVKRGNYIFMADGIDGLKIIDVLYPNNPLLIAAYHTSGVVTNVALDNNYAYIADSQKGLIIVDIAVPSVPLYAAMYKSSGQILSLQAREGLIYMSIANSGLLILRFEP
jgi:hypothetical protein